MLAFIYLLGAKVDHHACHCIICTLYQSISALWVMKVQGFDHEEMSVKISSLVLTSSVLNTSHESVVLFPDVT